MPVDDKNVYFGHAICSQIYRSYFPILLTAYFASLIMAVPCDNGENAYFPEI